MVDCNIAQHCSALLSIAATYRQGVSRRCDPSVIRQWLLRSMTMSPLHFPVPLYFQHFPPALSLSAPFCWSYSYHRHLSITSQSIVRCQWSHSQYQHQWKYQLFLQLLYQLLENYEPMSVSNKACINTIHFILQQPIKCYVENFKFQLITVLISSDMLSL